MLFQPSNLLEGNQVHLADYLGLKNKKKYQKSHLPPNYSERKSTKISNCRSTLVALTNFKLCQLVQVQSLDYFTILMSSF